MDAYRRLSAGQARPMGWLLEELRAQAAGLTGQIDEFWPSLDQNSGWLGKDGESWERGPYYLDGLIPAAYLLNDERLKAKAQKWIDWTLSSVDREGFFGPRTNRDNWPRMVMLKALIQYFEFTADARVPHLMRRYFDYLKKELPVRPLYDWGCARGGELVFSILWLYEKEGGADLIDLCGLVLGQTVDWSDYFAHFPFTRPVSYYYRWDTLYNTIHKEKNISIRQSYLTHVVNVAMALKTPALKYRLTGEQAHKKALLSGLEALKKYHGVASGVFTGSEHLMGASPSQGTELCAVVEELFSLQLALPDFIDSPIPDLIEKIAFGALPGTFTRDYMGHQYLQQANQVLCTKEKRDWFNNGDDSNLFGLEPNFGCCAANMHQGWAKFPQSLALSGDHELLFACYAPCAIAHGGMRVTLETDYPYSGRIDAMVQSAGNFTLSFRVPLWCQGAVVDGRPASGGEILRISRDWREGDRVTLIFPMKPRVSFYANGSAAVEIGPLVYSLKIGEEWRRVGGPDRCPDYELRPTTPWNYALILNDGSLAPGWRFDGQSRELFVRARRLPEWGMEHNSAQDPPQSPVATEEPDETITLAPYGRCKLRVTQFPWTCA